VKRREHQIQNRHQTAKKRDFEKGVTLSCGEKGGGGMGPIRMDELVFGGKREQYSRESWSMHKNEEEIR